MEFKVRYPWRLNLAILIILITFLVFFLSFGMPEKEQVDNIYIFYIVFGISSIYVLCIVLSLLHLLVFCITVKDDTLTIRKLFTKREIRISDIKNVKIRRRLRKFNRSFFSNRVSCYLLYDENNKKICEFSDDCEYSFALKNLFRESGLEL